MTSPFVYDIHLPSNIGSGKKYPVVFALHGIGYNEQHMLALVEDLKEDFILIGIRGHLTHENGYAYYYLKGYGNPERELFDDSVEKLKNFIDYVSNQYPIDPERKYLIGFSQGAILSMTLALILGDTIKGIVPMNGYIPSFVKEEYPLKSIARMSVFLCQGESDPIFPLNIGQENYDYLHEHAGSVKYTIYPSAHEISLNNQRDLITWLHEDSLSCGEKKKSSSLASHDH
ncbi:alpha/beta hydrolase [Bacillus songklensis]|uniref:Alpha/beta hydrolase n=1 Tax=Bacillus songklensis TaxID=1069116 RepID=A0ABV8B8L8_9BACI